EGYEYGSFHFLEPSFLHNYTDSTVSSRRNSGSGHWKKWMEKELESARISYVANPAFVILTGQDWVIRLNRYHYFLGLPVQFALLWLFGVYE
ncbi:hypothetical protein ABND66_14445, partial [Paenibacillus larvae]